MEHLGLSDFPAAKFDLSLHVQESFDKQYVRDWLEGSGWNKQPPAPQLPADVVAGAASRYREAYEWLTGQSLDG